LELNESDEVAQSILQAVPSTAQDKHHRETAQQPQQQAENIHIKVTDRFPPVLLQQRFNNSTDQQL